MSHGSRNRTAIVFGYDFHHIGVACADIEDTAQYLRTAYAIITDTGTVHDSLQHVDVRLFNEGTPGCIELVSGPGVEPLIRRGLSYYHICYAVPEIDAAIARAAEVGARCVSPPKPAVLFGGRRVAFVFGALGLVEFLET